jgi:Gamma-glutamyl cyclotransferase, AIG2-like
MTYFFFGTLMDRDVLATVLGRLIAREEMAPGWLHDYRRVRAATVSYPLLVRSPGVVVSGVVFHPRDARDDVRIQHFEGEEYAERWLNVHLAGGQRRAARVFFGIEALRPTEEPWDLAAWTSAHKAAFLEQCREWMCDCPACGPAAPIPSRGGR